ncbi:MAG: hypothetical protein M0D53_12045 [Flavobacterium sp. JAD_PAG50586_2]|nr:MAG: hypothetical protein M0D53_12045 [Flavobacterium sp. JAD_PAG50586_2]
MKKLMLKSVLLLSILFCACSSDDNDSGGNSYPKEVSITYKVSSSNTTSAQAVSYKNATGGMATVTNVALPYTITVNRTVNEGDDASIGYSSANASANVTLQILVDNSVVKTQNFTVGTGAIQYLFE